MNDIYDDTDNDEDNSDYYDDNSHSIAATFATRGYDRVVLNVGADLEGKLLGLVVPLEGRESRENFRSDKKAIVEIFVVEGSSCIDQNESKVDHAIFTNWDEEIFLLNADIVITDIDIICKP